MVFSQRQPHPDTDTPLLMGHIPQRSLHLCTIKPEQASCHIYNTMGGCLTPRDLICAGITRLLSHLTIASTTMTFQKENSIYIAGHSHLVMPLLEYQCT